MDPYKMNHFKDKELLIPVIREMIHPGDVVLIKGSRGMEMDKIVKCLMEE